MDKLAVIQAEETIKELNAIDVKTKELVGTFKILVEQTDKISMGFGKGTPKELIQSVNASAAAQKEYEDVLNSVSKATSELERLKKRIAFAQSDEGKQVAALRVHMQNLNRENKEQVQDTQTLSSAYDELNRKHTAARKNAMDLGVQHGIASKQFLEAAAAANQYDQKLKQIDSALGKHNRNVGNYNDLQTQVTQVMREAPNFAIDPRIGIMSLTNNLPMLAEAMSDVTAKNKAMRAEFIASAAAAQKKAAADAIATGASQKAAAAIGLQAKAQVMANYESAKAPGLLKQIGSSLLSWQTILIVGLGALMMYNKEIIAWTKGLLGVKTATEDLNKARQEGAKSAATEITNLDKLYKVATNAALSIEQRTAAVRTLQKEYPSFFANMSTELIMTGKAINQYKSLRDAILESARARAIGKKLEERQGESLEDEEKVLTRIRDLEKERARLAANPNSGRSRMVAVGGPDRGQILERMSQKESLDANAKDIFDYYGKLRKIRKDFNDDNEALINEQIKIESKTNVAAYDSDKLGTAAPAARSPRTKKERDTSKQEERDRLAALKAEFERERDNIENLYKVRMEAVKNNIELAKKDPYASDVSKIEKQIKYYDELIQENNDYYNALIENARKYGEKTKDLETSRDVSSISLQGNRNELYAGMMGASQSDITRQSEYLKTLQGITFEEQKQKILSDKTLDVTQREYLISVLERDNQITQNKLEIDRLKTMRGQLAAKLAMAQLGGGMLTPEEQQQLANIDETIAGLENANIQLNIDIASSLTPQLQIIKNLLSDGFRDLGLDNFANQFDNLFDRIKDKTADWKDYMAAAVSLVADLSTQYVEAQKERQIAALDEQLKASQVATEQELGFIDSRLQMLYALDEATKEQITERSALEDEARTLREQQMQREKQIEAQKAKAQQRASAQQAVINGILGATMAIAQLGPIAGAIPAAIALATGGIMAALIMAKDPVPKYFIGRKGGPEEMAWTQEKGREIITDKTGNIKSLGSDGGATLTKLDAGDNVYTASETAKILADFEGTPKVGANLFRKIAKQNINPVFVHNQNIDIDKLAGKIGDRFEMVARKYDKTTTFEDADGNIFKQKGGQIPEFIGRKSAPKQRIEIKLKNRDVRD